MQPKFLVGAAVIVAVGVGVAAVWAVRSVLTPEEVGPDAAEMAKDPLLDLDMPDLTVAYTSISTGKEGGVAPAMTNPTSEATRGWDIARTDWETVLRELLDGAAARDVTWWDIECRDSLVSLDGAKQVTVGEEVVVARVGVDLDRSSDPLRLRISLLSDGTETSTSRPAESARPPVGAGCPEDLAAYVT